MGDDRHDRTVEGPSSAEPSPPEWGGARGVLLVEADPDLQWRLARELTVEGHRVVGTSSGEGALALLGEWQVDVVIVDEDLPGMDGLEVLRRVRSGQPGVPTVLLTSEDGPDVQVAARLAGAARCVRKPVTKDTLLGLVQLTRRDELAAE